MDHRAIAVIAVATSIIGCARTPSTGGDTPPPSTGTSTTTASWCTPTDRYVAFSGGTSYSISSPARSLFIARRGSDCPVLSAAFRSNVQQCQGTTCASISPTDPVIVEAMRELAAVKPITFTQLAGCPSISHFVGESFEALSLCPEVDVASFPATRENQDLPTAFDGCIIVPCLPNTCSGGDSANPRINLATQPTCDCPQDRTTACAETQAGDCTCYEQCCS